MSAIAVTEGTAVDLVGIAAAIDAEHAAAEKAASSAVDHAMRAGILLIQAKKACGHGGWLGWLEKNVAVQPRMAQNYMALARALPKLKPEEAQRVAHLPVRDAVLTITKGANRLARVPTESRERIAQAVDAGTHTFAAVAKAREDERAAILYAPVLNPYRTVTGCWDHWSTVKQLIETKAQGLGRDISRGDYPSKHLASEAEKMLLPGLPDRLEGQFVPKAVFDEMRARRLEMRKELKRRIKNLVMWASEQRALVAAPLFEAAATAADTPVLIARQTSYSNNSQTKQFDLGNMAVPCKVVTHMEQGCICRDAKPLWCPS